MLEKMQLVTALVIIAMLLVSCQNHETENAIKLAIGNPLAIPSGYKLIATAEYGRTFGVSTFYVQHNESGRVYILKNGQIGAEVVLPDGYVLAGVSAYGEIFSIRTFYCRNQMTDETFECRPR